MTLTQPVWESLVAETQFATELTLAGLRRLCAVPTDPELVKWGSKGLNYALHVGMYSYSSGLERLCKLAIACNGYASTGEFPKLRKYSHKIGNLLDAVEALTPMDSDASTYKAKYLVRPVDALDPDLMNTVERFANGTGREAGTLPPGCMEAVFRNRELRILGSRIDAKWDPVWQRDALCGEGIPGYPTCWAPSYWVPSHCLASRSAMRR